MPRFSRIEKIVDDTTIPEEPVRVLSNRIDIKDVKEGFYEIRGIVLGFCRFECFFLGDSIVKAISQGGLELLPLPCSPGFLVHRWTLFWDKMVPGGNR